ncbi:MAG TPA: carboxyl transferase domain-containing protein, partial [Acidimicrobiales bacterium]|nr:carboxyl transferase domain-containing protein [Acidimicrobiales bacterium]
MAAPVLRSAVDPHDITFGERREGMIGLLGTINELLREASAGGGEAATARHRGRGKLTVRERVALLLDPDSPFLELSPLAGYQTDYNVGGGMLLGIGVVEGTECVILGNDPTDLGGAMTALSIRKLMRALQIARENRLPYIQFVESAGGDLRGLGSGDDPQTAMRRNLTHFAESGRMFHDITELSASGIPTISVVFGSSTAGGAYQPGLSDYNIFVRGGAKVFLGGPPLVKAATGEDSVDEELGGADMHGSVSGLADYLADDETEAIRMARDVIAHLHWRKLGPGPVTTEPDPPKHDPEELLGLMPLDLRSPVDAREIVARVVDGSRFEEFKPRYGPTLVTGWAEIHGFPVGILANNGVLFSDSSQKAAQFIQLCNQVGTPLLFLQHITGYMVGRDYERGGIVKHGSQM